MIRYCGQLKTRNVRGAISHLKNLFHHTIITFQQQPTYVPTIHLNNVFRNKTLQCNAIVAHRNFGAPTTSCWCWVESRVPTHSSARARLGRACITPLLKVAQPVMKQAYRRTVAAGRSTIGYRQVVLPNQRVVIARRACARDQATHNSHFCLI